MLSTPVLSGVVKRSPESPLVRASVIDELAAVGSSEESRPSRFVRSASKLRETILKVGETILKARETILKIRENIA